MGRTRRPEARGAEPQARCGNQVRWAEHSARIRDAERDDEAGRQLSTPGRRRCRGSPGRVLGVGEVEVQRAGEVRAAGVVAPGLEKEDLVGRARSSRGVEVVEEEFVPEHSAEVDNEVREVVQDRDARHVEAPHRGGTRRRRPAGWRARKAQRRRGAEAEARRCAESQRRGSAGARRRRGAEAPRSVLVGVHVAVGDPEVEELRDQGGGVSSRGAGRGSPRRAGRRAR